MLEKGRAAGLAGAVGGVRVLPQCAHWRAIVAIAISIQIQLGRADSDALPCRRLAIPGRAGTDAGPCRVVGPQIAGAPLEAGPISRKTVEWR